MITLGTLTWNNLEYLKSFIESTKVFTAPFRLCVWNNGSEDGTYDYLHAFTGKEDFGQMQELVVHHSEDNKLMSIPMNWILGMCMMSTDSNYAFVCNDDIVFHESINSILPFMESDKNIGLCCPSILPKETKIENIGMAADVHLAVNKDKIDSGLEGPCMCIPKEVIEKVGFFDIELANSYQDMEMHQRLQAFGYKTLVYYNSVIWHKGGVSTSKNPDVHNPKYYEYFKKRVERGYK